MREPEPVPVPPPAKRHHIGFLMLRPTPQGQRRVVVEASTEGVHQTAQLSGVIVVGNTRVWTSVQEAPPLRTADQVLASMAKVSRETGALSALVDAWTKVVELRARDQAARS